MAKMKYINRHFLLRDILEITGNTYNFRLIYHFFFLNKIYANLTLFRKITTFWWANRYFFRYTVRLKKNNFSTVKILT